MFLHHYKKFSLLSLFILGLCACLIINFSFELRGVEASSVNISVKNYKEQAASLYNSGQYYEAIALLEKLLEYKGLSTEEKASIKVDLASVYLQVGSLDGARQQLQGAADMYSTKQDNVRQLAAVLTDLARLYNSDGSFRLSIYNLKKANDLAAYIKDRLLITRIQLELGNAHMIAGDYQSAIAAYEKGLNTAKQYGYKDYVIIALNNLSNVYKLYSQKYLEQSNDAKIEGNLQYRELEKKALYNRKKAIDTAFNAVNLSKRENSFSAVRAHLNLLRVSTNLKKEKVARLIRDTERLLDNLPDSEEKVYSILNLSELTNDQKTNQLIQWAISTASATNNLRSESFALGMLGKHYFKIKSYQQALKLSDKAQLAARKVGASDSFYRWAWLAGKIYKATGKTEEAVSSYREAIQELQNFQNSLQIYSPEAQSDFRTSIKPVYQELIGLLLSGEPSNKQIKEALKVKNLLQIRELQNFFGDECVGAEIISREPKNFTSKTVVIYSLILEDKSYLVLQKADGDFKIIQIALDSPLLLSLIQKWRYTLENRANDNYLSLSRRLYELLIHPFEDELAKIEPEKIVFINDGLLRNVPMAALYDGKKFLVEQYSISYALGTYALSKEKTYLTQSVLSFGLSVAIEPFPALPYVREELQNIRQILGGESVVDREFTLETFGDRLLKNESRVIHIATHGDFGGTSDSIFLQTYKHKINFTELESALISSQFPIQLLTLSACDTAAGNDRAVLGLAGLAIRSGVKHVLGSLWAVEDESIVDLVSDFYKEWQSGKSQGEALRLSQIKLIKNPNCHPAIWSSFILIDS